MRSEQDHMLARRGSGRSRTLRRHCAARKLGLLLDFLNGDPRGIRRSVCLKNPVDGVGLFVKFPARLADLEQQA
jgi:hypothetical protein